MCNKVPYPSQWMARLVLRQLRAKGKPVRAVHPCFDGHPGAWHVTRSKSGW